jgi:hypothetical protein
MVLGFRAAAGRGKPPLADAGKQRRTVEDRLHAGRKGARIAGVALVCATRMLPDEQHRGARHRGEWTL